MHFGTRAPQSVFLLLLLQKAVQMNRFFHDRAEYSLPDDLCASSRKCWCQIRHGCQRTHPITWPTFLVGSSAMEICLSTRRKFSNRNLSFNPAWYVIKDAKGWLEYSEKSDRIYCYACCLKVNIESEMSQIGSLQLEKGAEGLKNHYKCTQHKCAENANEHFLQKYWHIDVLLDKSQEEITRTKQEIEKYRCYLTRLVDIAKILAKCGMPFRGHNQWQI